MARIDIRDESSVVPVSAGDIGRRGAAAGIVGAVVMGMIAMIVSAVRGMGLFTPFALMGATFTGADWAETPLVSGVVGLVTHLAVGAFYGVLFVALTRRVTSTGARIAAGLAYGAAVFLFMTYLVLPWANPVLYAAVPKGAFLLAHLAYGVCLPLGLPYRRSVVTRRRAAT